MTYQHSSGTLDGHAFEDSSLCMDMIQGGAVTAAHAEDYKEYKGECDDAHNPYPAEGSYHFNSFNQHDNNFIVHYAIMPPSLQLTQDPAVSVSSPPTLASMLPDADGKILAHMQVFTLVKEQTTDKELFRLDIDHNIEFSSKDLLSYTDFRNVLRYKTQAGYLKTQFFRVCLLSEIEQYKAPINSIVLSRLAKPEQETTHKSIMTQIKWIVDDDSLHQALQKYYLEQLSLKQSKSNDLSRLIVPGSTDFCTRIPCGELDPQARNSSNPSRLRLAVVRFTKTQAQNLGIEKDSVEHKYYLEAMSKKRTHTRSTTETGRYMGEWLRGDFRLYDDVLMQNNKNNLYKLKNSTIQDNDHIKFISNFNDFAVPRSLGYVTVRSSVTSQFLDFVIDFQQACAKTQLPPLKVLAQMPDYADFYHTCVEPLLKDSRPLPPTNQANPKQP